MLRYLILINIIGFILMGYDKKQAVQKKYRIAEFVLLTVSFLGGGFGSLFGMILFHHKTKKLKFQILVPISILLSIYILKSY